jgi:tetratricopeptide (TPR) repeat protein
LSCKLIFYGRYEKAEEILNKSLITIKTNKIKNKYISYLAALSCMGTLYASSEQYFKAEKTYLKCIKLMKKNNKTNGLNYAIILGNLCLVYYSLGEKKNTRNISINH